MSEKNPKPFTPQKAALYVLGAVALIAALSNAHHLTSLFAKAPEPQHDQGTPSAQPTGSVFTPPPAPKDAGPAELAVVAPVKVGSMLSDYKVLAIYGIHAGSIWVVCGKDKGVVHLNISLAMDAGPLAPTVVGPYAIFHSAKDTAAGDLERVATAFGELMKANAAVPVPPGLSSYAPGPLPAAPEEKKPPMPLPGK